MSPEFQDQLARIWSQPQVRTYGRRTIINRYYMARASSLLREPAYQWLRHDGELRMTILTELGRLDNDDDIRAVAALLCERKPRTKDAVAAIRAMRLGRISENVSEMGASDGA